MLSVVQSDQEGDTWKVWIKTYLYRPMMSMATSPFNTIPIRGEMTANQAKFKVVSLQESHLHVKT